LTFCKPKPTPLRESAIKPLNPLSADRPVCVWVCIVNQYRGTCSRAWNVFWVRCCYLIVIAIRQELLHDITFGYNADCTNFF
jgi:hypothetical protein